MSVDRNAVSALGERIGFGNMMHLASAVWRESTPGGEFVVGACAAATEPCLCRTGEAMDHHCDWCCGSGWLTHAVASLVRARPKRRGHR